MSRPSLLWVSHFVPYPPKGGAFQRSYNLLKQVSKKYDVHLVAVRHKDETHSREEGAVAAEELGRFCKKVVIVVPEWARSRRGLYAAAILSLFSLRSFTVRLFEFRELQAALREILGSNRIDIAHLDAISLAPYVMEGKGLPTVLNHHGAEGHMMARRIARETSVVKKLYYAIEAWKLKRDERILCPLCDVNTVVSEYDEELLRIAAPSGAFAVIENGVDLDYFSKLDPNTQKDSIIFSGRLDQYSNADGIKWFCLEAWPMLKQQFPGLYLRIIGRNPHPDLVKIAETDDRIQLLGYVDDIRPHFARAYLSVVPLRDGGGTRIKVLDAMAMGMPIVATTVACEGLHLVPDRDLRVANTPQEFVDTIGSLIRAPDERNRLAVNARAQVEKQHGWDAIGQKLCKVYEELERK